LLLGLPLRPSGNPGTTKKKGLRKRSNQFCSFLGDAFHLMHG
jgi:hypothetical protein